VVELEVRTTEVVAVVEDLENIEHLFQVVMQFLL
jgi:hypothetical protein